MPCAPFSSYPALLPLGAPVPLLPAFATAAAAFSLCALCLCVPLPFALSLLLNMLSVQHACVCLAFYLAGCALLCKLASLSLLLSASVTHVSAFVACLPAHACHAFCTCALYMPAAIYAAFLVALLHCGLPLSLLFYSSVLMPTMPPMHALVSVTCLPIPIIYIIYISLF